jgi:LysR family glycine cleavage system transcriptional activator
MAVQQITAEEFFPICSPRLLGGTPELRSPTDLRFRTIIRTTSNILGDYWPSWLEQAGVPNITFQDDILCDTLSTSVQAAIEGLGVAMGRSTVVASDLRNGRLVEPFSPRLPSGSEGYYLVARSDCAELRKVKVFSHWILASFGSQRITSGRA